MQKIHSSDTFHCPGYNVTLTPSGCVANQLASDYDVFEICANCQTPIGLGVLITAQSKDIQRVLLDKTMSQSVKNAVLKEMGYRG